MLFIELEFNNVSILIWMNELSVCYSSNNTIWKTFLHFYELQTWQVYKNNYTMICFKTKLIKYVIIVQACVWEGGCRQIEPVCDHTYTLDQSNQLEMHFFQVTKKHLSIV